MFLFHKMDLDLIRHHAEALKGVVDIQINDSQDVVTFGRVGREIWKRTVPAVLVIVAAIAYGCVLLTVEAVILAVLVTAAVCAYLAGLFRKISVNIPEKSLGFSLFNIMFSEIPFSEYRGPLVYMLTLNGREPSPKEFCAKFWHDGRRKEVTIANLTDGNGPSAKEQLTHILELWRHLEDLMDTDDFDTEFQMSGRNAIFA